MSDKQRWPRLAALKVAGELVAALTPCCYRIEVAGSLRRGKESVGDIELLFIPNYGLRGVPGDMFASEMASLADEKINQLCKQGVLKERLSKSGVRAWGKENKLAVHIPSGIPVDFFTTDEDRWFVALVVRTGGKDSNLTLTTSAQRLGRKLHAYGMGVEWPDGIINRCNREEDVFEFCGVPYRKPEDRP